MLEVSFWDKRERGSAPQIRSLGSLNLTLGKASKIDQDRDKYQQKTVFRLRDEAEPKASPAEDSSQVWKPIYSFYIYDDDEAHLSMKFNKRTSGISFIGGQNIEEIYSLVGITYQWTRERPVSGLV